MTSRHLLVKTLLFILQSTLFHSRERVICPIEEKHHRCKAVVMHTFNKLDSHVIAAMDAKNAFEAVVVLVLLKGERRH